MYFFRIVLFYLKFYSMKKKVCSTNSCIFDSRLREYCERLMFYNPLYYGRKAEEVLWRKVFYEIIQIIKKNRRVKYFINLSIG